MVEHLSDKKEKIVRFYLGQHMKIKSVTWSVNFENKTLGNTVKVDTDFKEDYSLGDMVHIIAENIEQSVFSEFRKNK